MDSIARTTMQQAGEAIDALDLSKLGQIHTVTVVLDGRTGNAMVTVESILSGDLVFQVG